MSRSRMIKFISGFQFGPSSAPLMLLVACALAYGLLLPGLGFYWDDWPWVWLSHLHGQQGMLQIDRQFRPLAGVILWWGALISGKSPLGWQLLNLLYRWLTALSFWWFLRRLWPRQAERAAWAALLFLLYPGFTQQYIAINSSRHILPLAVCLLSFGLMASAVRQGRHRPWLWGGALVTALVGMLTSEYYFGLELARPLVLWLALDEREPQLARRLKRTLAGWAGFLVMLILVFAWRYSLSQHLNYPVTLTGQLAADPLGTLILILKTVFVDAFEMVIGGWAQAFSFPGRADLGLQRIAFYALLIGISALLAGFYLHHVKQDDNEENRRTWLHAAILGLAAVLVAGLPFLATGIQVDLTFPSDRTTLPFIFGVSLLLVGVLDGLLRNRAAKIALLSLLVGFAAGAHFLNAIAYQREWQAQRDLFSQLSWRAPGIQPGTAVFYLYNLALQDFHSTDNSLTAPLNWMYAPDFTPGGLPYMLFDLRLRSGGTIPDLQPGVAIRRRYGDQALFESSTSAALVIYYAPPGCLRLLHPEYDALDPLLPDLIREALPLANLARIETVGNSARWLEAAFGPEPVHGWCYSFELADLARQSGDWQRVIQVGELAFAQPERPHHAAELVPFIQAYAHLGDWPRAAQLTEQALRINTQYDPFFCAIWRDLWQNTPDTPQKQAVITELQAKLDCSKP